MMQSIRSDWQTHGRAWLVTILVSVFGLQELRVLLVGFVGYLRDAVGMSSLDLAPVAIGVFALSVFAGLVNRLAGTRNALWITAGGLALVRIGEQLTRSATSNLYLSIAGVVLFLMYIPIALGRARAEGEGAATQLATGLLLGFALDGAIFVGAETLDLSWQSGFLPLGIVLVLAGALLWALSATIDDTAATDGSWPTSNALHAVGPLLFLEVLIFQNVALIGSLSGWEIPGAGLFLALSNAMAMAYAGRIAKALGRMLGLILLGLVLIGLLFLVVEPRGMFSAVWLLLGNMICFGFLLAVFQRAAEVEGPQGLLRTTLTSAFGQVLFVLVVFVYYASYDINLGVRPPMVPPIGAALVLLVAFISGIGRSRAEHEAQATSPAWLAAALAIVPLALMLTWGAPSYAAAPAGTDSLKVMDYNLHNAVNTDGILDPQALIDAIEAEAPDVLVLQEVSRGWLTWGAMDMLSWMEQRLDMVYVWGPTADAQWGNAIFSRYPVTEVGFRAMPDDEILLGRGLIEAKVDVGGTTLNVIATHFSSLDSEDNARLVQASVIVDTWAGQPYTVVMGDFNARPNEAPIELIVDSGLIDVSAEIGEAPTYTYISYDPDHQIDYIFVSPDLGYTDFAIPRTTASDHLPLVATLYFE